VISDVISLYTGPIGTAERELRIDELSGAFSNGATVEKSSR
jgi:hypothetical protein